MRKVEIRGYVIYDPDEVDDGATVCGRIEDFLFNEDYTREWIIEPVRDIDYAEEDA